jgi:hypothetical protein
VLGDWRGGIRREPAAQELVKAPTQVEHRCRWEDPPTAIDACLTSHRLLVIRHSTVGYLSPAQYESPIPVTGKQIACPPHTDPVRRNGSIPEVDEPLGIEVGRARAVVNRGRDVDVGRP